MSNTYRFPCGCEFPICDPSLRPDGIPHLDIDFYNLPDCHQTWSLFREGRVKGIFQLESKLAKSWCKKVDPDSIKELSALIAIIRPGTLESKIDGKSMTQLYVDIKHGREKPKYIHESLEDILSSTNSILVFQEQCLNIVKKLAGFTGPQSELLRRAVGKKDAKLMAEIKIQFIEGCKNTGIVNDEEAEAIFGWIEKSQRYSFNSCLSPETLVETCNSEYKTLDDVQIGDYIKAPGKNKDKYVEVVAKYDNGLKEVYEFELESGKTIICTMDHEFLCEDGKKRTIKEIISLGHKIVCEKDE